MSDGLEIFRAGEFELDVAAYELRRNGRKVHLERQPMDLLILLVERRGQLVTHGDIRARLWGSGVSVDAEAAVHTAIAKVRTALGDSAASPAFIDTVSGKGYRFIAPVQVISATPPAASRRRHLVVRPDPTWKAPSCRFPTAGNVVSKNCARPTDGDTKP